MQMRRNRYMICCPNCGKQLVRCGSGSDLEIQCPKCHSNLVIVYAEDELRLRERESEYAAQAGRPERR
jgi:phage FluMu protein Com